MLTIAVYGDNCIDRYTAPAPADFVGGNAVNVAVHLAAQGAPVAYFGIIGDDAEGALVRDALSEWSVDAGAVDIRPGATAVTWIEVRNGERIVLGDRTGVQCPLSLGPEQLEKLARYPFIHCPAFTSWNISWRDAMPNLVDEIEYLAAQGAFVTVDFSELDRPDLAQILGSCLGAAFVSRGQNAGAGQLKETVDLFHRCGISEVVVTLGADGSISSDGSELIHVPARPITPIDTLGAGDAFIAGWLFGKAFGEDRRRRMERGTELAAQVCGYFGAWPNASARVRQEIRNAGTTNT